MSDGGRTGIPGQDYFLPHGIQNEAGRVSRRIEILGQPCPSDAPPPRSSNLQGEGLIQTAFFRLGGGKNINVLESNDLR